MKNCKYCKEEMPANASVCPNCKRKQSNPALTIVIVIIVIGIIGAAIGGNTTKDNAKEGSVTNGNGTETTTAASKFTYSVDKQYTGDYGIGYYIEGLVKNNTDKDYSYVQIEFVCYDKDGNNLGTAIDNTNNLLGSQTWKFKAMFLGSDSKNVAKCDYHEITSW